MAALDWADLGRTSEYRFYAVSQTDPDLVLCEIGGVDLGASSLTAGYYTDARTSGRLSVVGEGWPRGSFVRVVHSVPDWGYSRVLGTYMVAGDDATLSDGVWTYDLDLRSMLYAMSLDVAPRPWTLAANAQALDAMRQVCEGAGRRYVDAGATDARVKTVTMLEPGRSQLSRLYELADLSGNRVDVNGAGEVTISRYVRPATRTPALTLSDAGDARGLMFDGLKRAGDYLTIPSRAAVSYRYTTTSGGLSTDHYVTGVADATGATSAESRGYRVTSYRSVDELSPATAAQATLLARQDLADAGTEAVTFTCTTAELPLWEGDVVWLSVTTGLEAYRGMHRCLVQSLDWNFDGTMDLTLRDTSGAEGSQP